MNNNENNNDKETLSQLMDGEWQDLDPSGSVKAICANDELRATWSRYHLARDVMRNEPVAVDMALSARISQAIADEPEYSNVSAIAPNMDLNARRSTVEQAQSNTSVSERTESPVESAQPSRASGWRAGLSGLALAACVALATLIGLNVWQQGAPGSGNPSSDKSMQSVAAVPGVVLPEVEYVSNRGTYWVTPEAKRSAKAEKRLNALLSTHIERSPTAERSGMLPYSRLVGYDSVTSE